MKPEIKLDAEMLETLRGALISWNGEFDGSEPHWVNAQYHLCMEWVEHEIKKLPTPPEG